MSKVKKLFTIDDFMIAFVSALAYGFGERIPALFGCPELLCLVICFAVGIAVEEIVSKIVFSEAVQSKPSRRIAVYAAFIVAFLIGNHVSLTWMGESMVDALLEETAFVVGLPVIGFVVALLIRAYRIRKVRERYGDGSEGYVTGMSDEDADELNEQNQPVLGEYDAECAVKTRAGTYVGEKDGDVIYYLGIPYAKAPVGELRWKAPEPLDPSDAVIEAKNYGASAMQVENRGAISEHHRQDEDCLTLNVCTGGQKADGKRPVLVLFHHSGFAFGGSADPLLHVADYVSAFPDVVLVTFNYRLGVFGFIDLSEVPGGEAYADAPNLGLLDQIAALRWVKENIAAFGGDPERVTVAGFESGATCVCLLAASECARGLFSRAFVFNGNLDDPYGTDDAPKALTRDLLRETRATTMEELVRLEPEALQEAAQKIWRNQGMSAPLLDGRLVPADPYRAYRESVAADIEFIVGIPSDECRVFRSFIGGQGYEGLADSTMADIQKKLDGRLAAAVREYIEEQTALSSDLEAKTKFIDQWIALCAYRSAVKLAEGGNRVHLMYWGRKPLIENLGSGTVDVLATLFGNEDALEMYGGVVDKDLSEIMQAFMHKFVEGDALRLYRNEVYGVDALEWEPFPKALVVSDDECRCDTVEDRLTEVEGLADYMLR